MRIILYMYYSSAENGFPDSLILLLLLNKCIIILLLLLLLLWNRCRLRFDPFGRRSGDRGSSSTVFYFLLLFILYIYLYLCIYNIVYKFYFIESASSKATANGFVYCIIILYIYYVVTIPIAHIKWL